MWLVVRSDSVHVMIVWRPGGSVVLEMNASIVVTVITQTELAGLDFGWFELWPLWGHLCNYIIQMLCFIFGQYNDEKGSVGHWQVFKPIFLRIYLGFVLVSKKPSIGGPNLDSKFAYSSLIYIRKGWWCLVIFRQVICSSLYCFPNV